MIKKTALPILFLFSLATLCHAAAVSVDLATDKSVYRAGEPVKITITAANKSRAAANLLFGSGQSYDINITDLNKKDVWHWSHNKVFTLAVRHVKLLPRQKLKYDFTWEQLDNKGRPVKSGKYFIRGRLMLARQLDSPTRSFIIKLNK